MNTPFDSGWKERTVQLLGSERAERLANAHVLVAGLGGVGSMAAEMLCRAGVGTLTIFDGDIIQPGNINRQLPATHSTIGDPKADIAGKRLKDINPDLQLNVLNEFIRDERMEELLDQPYDYIVDAIDTFSPKIYLIYHAIRKGLKIASSMGSGGKLDPAKIKIADLSESYNCRLAYLLRRKLRKMGIEGGFKVVFSSEQVPKEMIIAVENEQNKKSTVGTISYIPAIFGCMLASVVIREIVEKSR